MKYQARIFFVILSLLLGFPAFGAEVPLFAWAFSDASQQGALLTDLTKNKNLDDAQKEKISICLNEKIAKNPKLDEVKRPLLESIEECSK